MLPLASLIHECAPTVAPITMAAIVQAESGGHPWALWDNTAKRGYYPKSRKEALRILRVLMAQGHQVDVGIAQVDTENFAQYHLTARTALNACQNLRAGSRILRAAWQKARSHGLSGQAALEHAFEVYNSGHLFGDYAYVQRVLGAAGAPVFLQVSVPGANLPGFHPNPWPQYTWTTKPAQTWSVLP
nr:lytic transglycosylase domain-containing protein [Acidithiobacillus montserratensis]